MKSFPMESRIVRPKTYDPSYDTDIRRSIKRERQRIKEEMRIRDQKVAPVQGPRRIVSK